MVQILTFRPTGFPTDDYDRWEAELPDDETGDDPFADSYDGNPVYGLDDIESERPDEDDDYQELVKENEFGDSSEE